jgi:hypothetical protein
MIGDKKEAISTIENALALSLLSEPQIEVANQIRMKH